MIIKNLYFGAAGMSDLPFIRMNKGDKEILIDTRKMKIGQNLALIHLPVVGGPIHSCGIIQQRKKHIILMDQALKRRIQRQPTPRGRLLPLYPRWGGG